ncbi:MAM and LDL-receptor class A domain-containing protein 1 [Portunus trituberculatus]|uniref:MAM and LDL-receptor class A domain-containing protein 1 n=1 Tax=Portunus trituberculatus TaxID=210409 RepID=A0A5B7CEI9_PORTR|nr:MAM and LDL-receptor class A domain-containing protein 1 [Portunus trituberculatus]
MSDGSGYEVIMDHTLGNAAGYFLYVAEQPSEKSGPAVMVTKSLHNAFLGCTMNFWYRENSNNYYNKHMKLTISVVRDNEVHPLHYLIDAKTYKWEKATVRIMDWWGDFSVQVEGENTGNPSDLTLDDFSFEECGPPSDTPAHCPEYHIKCPQTGICVPPDFVCDTTNDCGNNYDEQECDEYSPRCTFEENGQCDWVQEDEEDSIGPPADHTTRLTTGHYLYITAPPHQATKEDKQSKKTYRAWFVSPTLKVDTDTYFPCQLRFHYYMYGKNIEELNIYTRTEIHGEKSLSFRRTGEQGQFWDRSVVTATEKVNFQFVIEGITNNEDFSDIAIDDLSFTESCIIVNASLPGGSTYTPPPSPCGDDKFYCGVAYECIPESKRCDWQYDCTNKADEDYCGACNFEYDMCDWYDGSAGIFQWRRVRAGDFSSVTHPNVDHTYNTSDGHFVYIESGAGIDGRTAMLYSPRLSHTAGFYCELHFWLYLESILGSNLTLYSYHDEVQGELLYDLMNSEAQEKVWFKAIATARKVPTNHQLVFEATPRYDTSTDWEESHSGLVIDDISFFNCNERTLSLDCKFDNEALCAWLQDQHDEQDWKKGNASSSSLADHTSGTGYYIYIDFSESQAKMNDAARLISTVQSKPSQYVNVLSLWYYFYGENVGIFRIIERKESTKTNDTLFELSTTQENKWLLYQEPMSVDDDFTIILEGTWREKGLGLLAVDDIKMTSTLHEAVCDFEVNFCQWVPSNESAGIWTRGQGAQNIAALPPKDHTHNSDSGYYAYLKTKAENEMGFLTSPVYKAIGVQCIRFWYHMLGDNLGHLKVEVADKSDDFGFVPIWSQTENTFEMWFQGMVTLPGLLEYSVRFMGVSGKNNNSVIALDDVTFVPGVCPKLYVCNFEYDMCEWINSDQDEFDWVISSGKEGGGILVDHTIDHETGHYLQTTLEGKKKGDRAQLFGPVVPSKYTCMTFWYSMQNIENATLIVKLMEDDFINIAEIHNSSLLYLWEEISLTPNALDDNYEIMLDLVIDEDITFSQYVTIAIDDIAFTEDCSIHTLPPITIPPPTHLPSSYDCDFEQDGSETCGWMQDTDDGIDWQLWKGPTPTSETGPQTDHTFLTVEGHYIYSGNNIVQNETTAVLKSPVVDIAARGACLSFWYHMHGLNVGTLQVMSQKTGSANKSTVWKRSNEQGDDWMQAKVHLTVQGEQYLLLQSTLRASGAGDIAIDDIIFDFGKCYTGILCDFESGNICHFEQSLDDKVDWQLVQGSDSADKSDMIPGQDHSLQSPLGHYLQLSGEGYADIYTNEIDAQYGCVEFSVYLNGYMERPSAQLNVHIRRSGSLDPKPAVVITGPVDSGWSRYLLPVTSSTPYSLAFRGNVEGGAYVIGIDDVKPRIYCEPMSDCNFETDTCMWNNLDDDDFDWSLTTGEDLDNIYAPAVDVTLGSPLGKYIYVDTTRAIGTTDKPKAILETNAMNTKEQCIRFWYHIQVVNASLALKVKYLPFVESEQLWEAKATIQAEWKYQQVSIERGGLHTIQFVAASDRGKMGIIALDQVIVDSHHCTNETIPDCVITCDGGKTCIHENQMCNFIQECGNGDDEFLCGYNCTFEDTGEEHCMWSNVAVNDKAQTWMLLSGDRNKTNAPPIDHTFLTPSGHYMALMPGVGGQTGEETKAILQSPYLFNSASYCLMTFWYVMFGKADNISSTDIGTLAVASELSDLSVELLTVTGSQGDEWRYTVAYVGRIYQKFMLKLIGNRNLDMSGYIAVDDIRLDNCFLPTPLTKPEECKHFLCENSACVSSFETCDFVDDCGDYSDENDEYAGCASFVARCSFEDGHLCDWNQEGPDDWLIASPDSETLIPKHDHTTNLPSGTFISIGSIQNKLVSASATISSPVMQWKTDDITPCMLRFFFYVDGPDVGELVVSLREMSDGPLIEQWKLVGAAGPFWEREELIVTPHVIENKPVQFLITGKTLNYTGGDSSVIAIDDISFSHSCALSDDPLPPTPSQMPTTTQGPCNDMFQCENGECVPLDYVCNFANDCGDGTDETMCADCDFDTNTCGWKDVSVGSYHWLREEPGVEGRKGQVMKVEERFGSVSKVAKLTSVQLGGSASACTMRFFYYKTLGLYGTTALHLYVKRKDNSEYRAWYQLDDMGDKWYEQYVVIANNAPGWSLRFEATHYDEDGLILIDDIQLKNCTLPSATICKHDEMKCLNGACVPQGVMCDFTNDCGDGTDEMPSLCESYNERCNFENDFCGWTQENETMEWIRRTGESLSEDVGPDFDHTLGNEKGYYMYLKSGQDVKFKTGRIASPDFYPVIIDCAFRFWYVMKADQGSKLIIYAEETSEHTDRKKEIIYETEGSEVYGWAKVTIPVVFTRYFKIVIEGTASEGIEGDVSIDDISFTPGCKPVHPPPTTSPPPGHCLSDEFECANSDCIPKSSVCDFRYDCQDSSDELPCPSQCNFEVDSCGWYEAVDDALNWILARANDSSFGTDDGGPYVDGSGLKQGHFLYLFATEPDLSNEEGYALSHWYQNSAPYCHLTYWYYVSGEKWSDVIVRLNTSSTEMMNLAFYTSETVVQNGVWHKDEVGIGRHKSPFQLSLYRKELTSEYTGPFAIDEMQFNENCHYDDPSEDTCLGGEYHCSKTKVCINENRLCDLSDDCGADEDEALLMCRSYHKLNLENDGWLSWFSQDTENDDLNWIMGSGSTPTKGTGPNFDHTTSDGSGHYLYVESSVSGGGKVARLITYPIKADPICSLTFFSHMHGRGMGYLRVLVGNDTSKPVQLMNITGEVGNYWVKQTVEVKADAWQVFHFIIEGEIGQGELSDIAVDDFVFAPYCKLMGSPDRNCTSVEHQCSDGTCLPIANRCNFAVECPNGDTSDEEGCVSEQCSFEGKDLCNWEIKSNAEKQEDLFTWRLIRGDDSLANQDQEAFKPTVDHTHGDSASYYAFTAASSGDYQNSTDLITTLAIGFPAPPPGPGSDHANHKDTHDLTTAKDENHIALDDLVFHNCKPTDECQSSTDFQCASGDCIPRQYTCDAKFDCYDKSDEFQCPRVRGDCNFDTGSWLSDCAYGQRTDDDLDWQQASASDQDGTGPLHDHTLGSIGYYVYVSSKTGEPGLLATIETEDEYPASQGICYIRFWYYMHTDHGTETVDIGILRVYLSDRFNRRYPVASESGNHEEGWKEVVILVNMKDSFVVMFEAETGTSEHTYIALDDVSFTPECETGVGPPPVNNTCGSGEVRCGSGECIPESYTCDCIADCLDASDEAECSNTCTTLHTRSTTSTTTTTPASTVTTTVNPYACTKKEFSCGDEDHTCIPALLLCDTIPDCPNKADETQCPENSHCDPGFFYCGDKFMSHHPCMTNDDVCNGIVQCLSHQADESVCGDCPHNYCQNGGVCAPQRREKRPACK